MVRNMAMNRIFQLNDDNCWFPSADYANDEGLLAFGGDLSPERLIVAYANGIFPWYNDDEPLLWWSLDPRLIMRPGEMKVSKSLRHTIRSNKFEIRIDADFHNVMKHCAEAVRIDQDGTWIKDEMIDAYTQLYERGLAHSFETYRDGELVGGLYGVSLGKVFCGESMFHNVSDASKFAFYHLHRFLVEHDFKLIDCQQETPHLISLGAYAIPRSNYLDELAALVKEPTLAGNWGTGSVELLELNIQQPETVYFRSFNLDAEITIDE
ncbi:MAG: leucyl/phenylalanyl-tRNA--protein transferase [Candidatus Limimorpha sp.]